MRRARVALAVGLGLGLGLVIPAAPAAADELDPCRDAILDPVTTPVRAVAIDAQRTACLRDELGGHLAASALIDTPGFRGVLGGELRLLGRTRLGRQFELDAGLRILRYSYVQNAVNKVTTTQLGPLTVGGAWAGDLGDGARLALVGLVELPYTRDELATMHTSGELAGVVTAALTARSVLHARLGMVAAYATSAGGDTGRVALRAGADLARQLGRTLALHAGVEAQAGWYRGLDHLNLRAGAHARFAGPWRAMIGVGVPVGGEERTNVILDLGIIRDMH